MCERSANCRASHWNSNSGRIPNACELQADWPSGLMVHETREGRLTDIPRPCICIRLGARVVPPFGLLPGAQYTAFMRRCPTVLWLVLISFVLTPFSTLHAHVSNGHDHGVVHGGHSHDFNSGDIDDVHTDTGQIIDMQLVASDRGTMPGVERLALASAPELPTLDAPQVTLILRPPPIDDPPIPRRSYWQPPLRGPPLVSITAR